VSAEGPAKTPIWTAPRIDCSRLTLAGAFDLTRLADLLRARAVPAKGPYFCPVSLVDVKASVRRTNNVRAVHALCLDSDAGYPHAEAKRALLEAGFRCLLYRSFSDGKAKDGKPACDRFRLVLPLAVPIPADKWSAIYGQAAELVLPEVDLDMACCDPARAWFFPPRPEVDVLCEGGELLDLSGLRVAPAPGSPIVARGGCQNRNRLRSNARSRISAVFDRRCTPEALAKVLESFGFVRHSCGTWEGLPQVRMSRPGKRRQDGCSMTISPGRTGGAWARVFSSSIPGLPPGAYGASAVIELLCGGGQ
jgi:hypothetical protein